MYSGPSGLPLLETRKVLMDHLYAKVLPLCQLSSFASDVAIGIAENLSIKEIINLLENEALLSEAVNSLLSKEHAVKRAIGERLFVAVARLNSELCAQITGMLLELDEKTLECLLTSSNKLEVAVQKARNEYLNYSQTIVEDRCASKEKLEDMGEVMYNLVLQYHPDPELAARLTGMLLELESCHLENLVQNPEQLKVKLDIACKALCKS